jgi:hypothetical protein
MLTVDKFNIKIVNNGETYGRTGSLVHDRDDPLVEFYDKRYPHTEYGQFVSRYYASTLLDGSTGGLCLDLGNADSWTVSSEDMVLVRAYLKAITDTPEPSPKVIKWELRLTWSDGEVEVMNKSLPESVLKEIEQHIVDLEDLREQDPEIYFMDNGK